MSGGMGWWDTSTNKQIIEDMYRDWVNAMRRTKEEQLEKLWTDSSSLSEALEWFLEHKCK